MIRGTSSQTSLRLTAVVIISVLFTLTICADSSTSEHMTARKADREIEIAKIQATKIKESFEAVMQRFPDKEAVQICTALSQRLDQQGLLKRLGSIEDWGKLPEKSRKYV